MKRINIEDWEDNPVGSADQFRQMENLKRDKRTLIQRFKNFLGIGEEFWTEEEAATYEIFLDLMGEEDYYAAAQMADTVLSDAPLDFENYASEASLNLIDGRGTVEEADLDDLKEAFTILDSFEYLKDVYDLEDNSWYIHKMGLEKLIDRVATDIWRELDGSSQAFFEKYISENTGARIFPESNKRLTHTAYKYTAKNSFQEELDKGDPIEARRIAERFELDEEFIEDAEDAYRLEMAKQSLKMISLLESEDRFDTDLGNFLTDTYLWRRDPEAAQEAGDESMAEDEVENYVLQLMDDGDFETAFAAMDVFDYDRLRQNIDSDLPYLNERGPARLIDWTATAIWQDLEGSAKAFYQEYLEKNDPESEDFFEQGSIAQTYLPGENRPRKKGSFREDA